MNTLDENQNSDPLEPEENLNNENDDIREEHEEEAPNIIEFYEEDTDSSVPIRNETLINLYELTKIDRDLAEIVEEKGDLPDRIEAVKDKMNVLESHLTEDKAKLTNFETEEKTLLKENKTLEDKISKYEDNKYKAKSNKEYDDITRQVETMLEVIEKNEARINELRSYQENLVKGILEMTRSNEELKADLKNDTAQLTALNKQYEDEETELTDKRKVILDKISEEYRTLYERINGSMQGEAIGIVRKGNCSGCYNSVPPQREIEIRMAKDIYLCQSCGRILIDETLINNL